jgi:hypothetical protein
MGMANGRAGSGDARTQGTARVLRWPLTVFAVAVLCALLTCPRPAIASPPPDPVELGIGLAADEQLLRDPSSSEETLVAAAHRQQAAYRALGQNQDWVPLARNSIPPSLLDTYDRNVDARRELTALTPPKDTLPAWRIAPPVPAGELLDHYRAAEAATGVDWAYLAAIHLIETGFGRIVGVSDAGAHGPMQFLPATFAAYGDGGDIDAPRDSIMAAARMLAANGFADNHDRAVFGYNHSDHYVRAIDDYAGVLADDPAAFAGYHRWDTYYRTTSGDVVLPIGYSETSRIPVGDYLATHPQ